MPRQRSARSATFSHPEDPHMPFIITSSLSASPSPVTLGADSDVVFVAKADPNDTTVDVRYEIPVAANIVFAETGTTVVTKAGIALDASAPHSVTTAVRFVAAGTPAKT